MLHVLHPVELLHAQRINALVDTDSGRGSSTGGNCVPRRILLQLNILVIYLLDVLLDLVISCSATWASTSLCLRCTTTNHI